MIQQQLGLYIKELKEEYAKDLVLPTKDSVKAGDKRPEKLKSMTKLLNTSIQSNDKSSDILTNLKSLKFEEEFKVGGAHTHVNDSYSRTSSINLKSKKFIFNEED